MAVFLTVFGAIVTLFGFAFLLWFIRRLGILELDAALMGADIHRPKMDPQPMVEVKNPFKMTVSRSASSGCVELFVSATQSCNICCYWRVKKRTLEESVVKSHSNSKKEGQDGNNKRTLQNILKNNYETMLGSEFTESCTDKSIVYKIEEHATKSTGEANLMPTDVIYDLVVTMELAHEDRDQVSGPCNIVAMLVGVELRKQGQGLRPHLVHQFIQSCNGRLFKVKKLYLEEALSSPSEQLQSEQEQDQGLCIVCQMLPISRALIPCGHACLCALCFDKMNSCPMCRNVITSSFILREEPIVNGDEDRRFSEILKHMNPIEIIRGIYNAS